MFHAIQTLGAFGKTAAHTMQMHTQAKGVKNFRSLWWGTYIKASGDSKEQRTHHCVKTASLRGLGSSSPGAFAVASFHLGNQQDQLRIAEGQSSALEIIYSAPEVTSPLLGTQDSSGGNNGGCK